MAACLELAGNSHMLLFPPPPPVLSQIPVSYRLIAVRGYATINARAFAFALVAIEHFSAYLDISKSYIGSYLLVFWIEHTPGEA